MLYTTNIDVELDKIAIERIILVVEQGVSNFGSKRVHIDAELMHDRLDFLKIVQLKHLELSDRTKKVDQLADMTAAKEL